MPNVIRPRGLSDDPSVLSAVRTVTPSGSLTADPTALTDANYPVQAPAIGSGFDPTNPAAGGVVWCGRLSDIRLGLENVDGTPMAAGQSIDISPIFFDRYGAVDNHWHQFLDASGNPVTVTLSNAGFVSLPVLGRIVFLRISAVGSTAITGAFNILAFPGDFYPA